MNLFSMYWNFYTVKEFDIFTMDDRGRWKFRCTEQFQWDAEDKQTALERAGHQVKIVKR